MILKNCVDDVKHFDVYEMLPRGGVSPLQSGGGPNLRCPFDCFIGQPVRFINARNAASFGVPVTPSSLGVGESLDSMFRDVSQAVWATVMVDAMFCRTTHCD